MRRLCFLWLGLAALTAAEPGLTLSSPRPDQVWQRDDKAGATVRVEGELALKGGDLAKIEVRIDGGAWQELLAWRWDNSSGGKHFSGTTRVPPGSHELEARVADDARPPTTSPRLRFSVGEVFLVTGQSNSANHGEGRQQAASGHVFTVSPKGEWRPCADPQPGASGNGGSFLPALGDEPHRRLGVPVGFLACGGGRPRVPA